MIQELYAELDEERNFVSTTANKAMTTETEMELRQLKHFVEEKIEHDQLAVLALEDLVYKREQSIQALTCEKV